MGISIVQFPSDVEFLFLAVIIKWNFHLKSLAVINTKQLLTVCQNFTLCFIHVFQRLQQTMERQNSEICELQNTVVKLQQVVQRFLLFWLSFNMC